MQGDWEKRRVFIQFLDQKKKSHKIHKKILLPPDISVRELGMKLLDAYCPTIEEISSDFSPLVLDNIKIESHQKRKDVFIRSLETEEVFIVEIDLPENYFTQESAQERLKNYLHVIKAHFLAGRYKEAKKIFRALTTGFLGAFSPEQFIKAYEEIPEFDFTYFSQKCFQRMDKEMEQAHAVNDIAKIAALLNDFSPAFFSKNKIIEVHKKYLRYITAETPLSVQGLSFSLEFKPRFIDRAGKIIVDHPNSYALSIPMGSSVADFKHALIHSGILKKINYNFFNADNIDFKDIKLAHHDDNDFCPLNLGDVESRLLITLSSPDTLAAYLEGVLDDSEQGNTLLSIEELKDIKNLSPVEQEQTKHITNFCSILSKYIDNYSSSTSVDKELLTEITAIKKLHPSSYVSLLLNQFFQLYLSLSELSGPLNKKLFEEAFKEKETIKSEFPLWAHGLINRFYNNRTINYINDKIGSIRRDIQTITSNPLSFGANTKVNANNYDNDYRIIKYCMPDNNFSKIFLSTYDSFQETLKASRMAYTFYLRSERFSPQESIHEFHREYQDFRSKNSSSTCMILPYWSKIKQKYVDTVIEKLSKNKETMEQQFDELLKNESLDEIKTLLIEKFAAVREENIALLSLKPLLEIVESRFGEDKIVLQNDFNARSTSVIVNMLYFFVQRLSLNSLDALNRLNNNLKSTKDNSVKKLDAFIPHINKVVAMMQIKEAFNKNKAGEAMEVLTIYKKSGASIEDKDAIEQVFSSFRAAFMARMQS